MILQVKNLKKSFAQGKKQIDALAGISFSVDQQQSLAIVGPSGSGKSTLISLLAGLDQASEGEILFEQSKLHQMSEAELNRFRSQNIGIVFQQFHLMPHLSAEENVALPLEILGDDQPLEKAQDMLKRVGLGERTTHRPHQLSCGECQRVAIARACVTRPKVLLADEPSGNLDTETGKRVMDILFDMVKETGTTLILITHDDSLAMRCQKQLKIVGGLLQ